MQMFVWLTNVKPGRYRNLTVLYHIAVNFQEVCEFCSIESLTVNIISHEYHIAGKWVWPTVV